MPQESPPSPPDPADPQSAQTAARHKGLIIALTVLLMAVPLVLAGLRLLGHI
jgi:hypothetical protein